MEEAFLLTEHINAHIPMISSFCPSGVQTVMYRMPAAQQILSTVISPPFITGLICKSQKMDLTVNFSICESRKAEQKHYQGTYLGYIDAVFTIDDLIELLHKNNIDLEKEPKTSFSHNDSRMSAQAMTAKGWLEAVIDIFATQFLGMKEVNKTYEKSEDSPPELGSSDGTNVKIAPIIAVI